jgi:hypothetical protein
MIFGRQASAGTSDSPGGYDFNGQPLAFTEWSAWRADASISTILPED